MSKTIKPAGFPVQKPLTEEEKKIKVIQLLQQKREQFAINILCNLCKALAPETTNADAANLVDLSVEMADKLIERLYPLPEKESENK